MVNVDNYEIVCRRKQPTPTPPYNPLEKKNQLMIKKQNIWTIAIRRTIVALKYFKNLMEMIKVEHTVFSVPFALLGAMTTVRGLPAIDRTVWIVIAVTATRTATMTFNRLADYDIDSKNPRTKNRALPTGQVSHKGAICLLGTSIVVFICAANSLGTLPRQLAVPTLLVILGYYLCKRFTLLSHIILGLSLAIAPLGASIAVNGYVDPSIWFLAAGVLTWPAGFDIIYALQDIAFDRKYSMHSIPACTSITNSSMDIQRYAYSCIKYMGHL